MMGFRLVGYQLLAVFLIGNHYCRWVTG
ncbi:hypothetical protein TIFTF001_052730 [Ficus carica]|uniref:Uncharacterized protein n=1 Tax=Ficus carica TaxID=3494 RepID=A0AA88JEX4_FICCA|nr:hypothetical protein TIFTF001_052730 [Ficus carica]